jgi:DNA repair protein RadC
MYNTYRMIYLRDSKLQIKSAEEVAKVFQDLLNLEDKIGREREHFYVMHLDARHKVKMVELVCVGVVNNVRMRVTEVFRRAVIENSVSIIVAHNHPSGDTEPSSDDNNFTSRLKEAGDLLGVVMVDHVVFTEDKYYSYRDSKTFTI